MYAPSATSMLQRVPPERTAWERGGPLEPRPDLPQRLEGFPPGPALEHRIDVAPALHEDVPAEIEEHPAVAGRRPEVLELEALSRIHRGVDAVVARERVIATLAIDLALEAPAILRQVAHQGAVDLLKD